MNKKTSFTPVLDSRKRKLRSLWKRGARYYARIKIACPGEDRPKSRRVPLKARNVIGGGHGTASVAGQARQGQYRDP